MTRILAPTRREALALGAAAVAVSGTSLATPAIAAPARPIRLGFLTVKTGPLASGGTQMEQGLTLFLKERKHMLVGRRVTLFTADTGGVPATARTKTQELVERDHVDAIIGPLAAFELLAIAEYTASRKIPLLSVAAAEDISQRHPDPYFVRCTSSSAQCSQPLADYARKTLKYKKMALIGDDIAYGQEQNAGFQRVFEDEGGEVVQKLWPPLNAPDYGTFIAQLQPDIDALFMSFAGSNGYRFFAQYQQYGGSKPIIGGMTAVDESVLPQMGPAAIGMISTSFYSSQLDYPANKRFVAGMLRDYKVLPGYYAAGTYISGEVLEAALRIVKGRIEDKPAFIHALRTNVVPNTARGPVRFDQFGNVIGNVYIRRVARAGGRLVNAVIKTYPDVSQFWTYNPAAFLKEQVYSRNWPPARHLGD